MQDDDAFERLLKEGKINSDGKSKLDLIRQESKQMPPTQTHNVNVSLETFNEIANALEAAGVKINADAPISITKDIKIKGPVDYRQVQIRRDVMQEVVKVYEPPQGEGDYCVSDSSHFIDFLDDVYSYILKGEKPKAPETIALNKNKSKPATGW